MIRVNLGLGEFFFVREHELEEEENADKLLSAALDDLPPQVRLNKKVSILLCGCFQK